MLIRVLTILKEMAFDSMMARNVQRLYPKRLNQCTVRDIILVYNNLQKIVFSPDETVTVRVLAKQ